MTEEWRDVVGYEGLYQVSNLGRVRNIRLGKERILTPVKQQRGYLQICICRHGKATTYMLHKVVAEAFLGPRPIGKQVNHRNGLKDDPRLNNLEYVTQSENMLHSYRVIMTGPSGKRNGSHTHPEKRPRGESHGNAVLNEALVRQIRSEYASGIPHRALAAKFGVGANTVLHAINRETWAHVT